MPWAAQWTAEPTPFSKIQLDPAHRLLAADLVGEEAVLEGLRGLRAHIDELREQLDGADETASAVPHREAYLKLNHRWHARSCRHTRSGSTRSSANSGSDAARSSAGQEGAGAPLLFADLALT